MLIAQVAGAFPSSRLVYTRGPGAEHCPDEPALRKAVAKRLGYDPFFPSADRTIVASIVRDAERLKAQAQLVDDHGIVRGLRQYDAEPPHCEDLIHALALSISISIDPANVAATETEPPTLRSSAEPAPTAEEHPMPSPQERRTIVPESRTPVPASTTLDSSPSVMWAAGLGARLSLGVEPSATTVGGAGSFSGRWRRGSVIVELGMDPPSSADLTGLTGKRVTVRSSLVWTAIAPCIHLDPVFFCGVAMAGRLSVHRADGDTRGDSQLVALSGGRFGVDIPLSRPFAFRGQADLLATLVRTPVTSGGERIWRAPGQSFSFTAGLVLKIP